MKCPSCKNEIPGWAREKCPNCGMPIHKTKNSLVPYLAAGVIVVVIIAVIYLLFIAPHFQNQQPCLTCNPPTQLPTHVPTPPPGTISVTGVRQGSTIMVTVMAGNGLTDAGNFTIQLNGVTLSEKLAANAGTSVRVSSAGAPGSDHLIVVTNYKNGAQQVVLNKNI